MKVLMKFELGCVSGGRSSCVLFCADGIILLGGSMSKMQKTLNTCNEFGKKCGINFNALKTKWFDLY